MARLNPTNRRRMIAQAALKVAQGSQGLIGVTHDTVAFECPVATSASTVRHYFSTVGDLQLECLALDPSLRAVAISLGVITK